MKDLSGINLAMQTPFHDDGRIDYTLYEHLIERYIDAGVHGIVLGAGTGQYVNLTEDEVNRLYELGIKRINGRCNVICQTSALNMEEVLRRSHRAQALGADALMILPPYFEGPNDDDGLFEFYREIDQSVNIDIIGYNIPESTGVAISIPLLKRLNELPNFNWIKDSGGDFAQHQDYIGNASGTLNGNDPVTVYSLIAGAKGAIWGAANYMPEETVKLYELTRAGDYTKALELWQRMLPSLLFVCAGFGHYLCSVLRAAQLRGFGNGNVRKPLRALAAEYEKPLRESLAALDS